MYQSTCYERVDFIPQVYLPTFDVTYLEPDAETCDTDEGANPLTLSANNWKTYYQNSCNEVCVTTCEHGQISCVENFNCANHPLQSCVANRCECDSGVYLTNAEWYNYIEVVCDADNN